MDNPTQDELRDKMRQLRNIGRYSQKDLAQAMGIEQPTYFRVENGKIKFGLKHLAGCSSLFEVSLADLLNLSTEELAPHIKKKSSHPASRFEISVERIRNFY